MPSESSIEALRQLGSPADRIRGRSHRPAADVLLAIGKVERARDEYRKAVEADASLEDEAFADQIGPYEDDDDLPSGRGLPGRLGAEV